MALPGADILDLPAPLAALVALVLPSLCAACGAPRRGFGGGGACSACWDALPGPDPTACPLCALPSDGACPACRRQPPPLEASFAAGPYAGTLKKLVHAFKFEGFDLLAPRLARAMAEAARRPGGAGIPDGTVACGIPSTPARNRERGYDPGPLLALELSRRLGLACRPLLLRSRSGARAVPQSSLPAAERRRNVAGVFSARRGFRGSGVLGLSVLLVDDVMTTGATAFEAAATLRSAGAASVRLLVLARTPLPSPPHPEPA